MNKQKYSSLIRSLQKVQGLLIGAVWDTADENVNETNIEEYDDRIGELQNTIEILQELEERAEEGEDETEQYIIKKQPIRIDCTSSTNHMSYLLEDKIHCHDYDIKKLWFSSQTPQKFVKALTQMTHCSYTKKYSDSWGLVLGFADGCGNQYDLSIIALTKGDSLYED